jgi:putative oxidoreductase
MHGVENVFILIGRLAICAFFLWTAFEKIKHWKMATDFLKSKKVPLVSYVLPISVGLQVVGGLSLLFGLYTHLGALLLLIYMIPHTCKMHDFWNMEKSEKQSMSKLNFMKDVAIAGGLLIIFAIGGGAFSVHS